MRTSVSHLILAVLALASILMLTYAANTPVLFSAENRSGTLYHRDLQHETTIEQTNSSTVLPLMDELLQDTATITIKINARDLEGAKKQIRAALTHAEHLENVVVDLEMEGSDADEFVRENKKDLKELYEIVNESGRFEEVQSVEIRQKDRTSNRTRSIVYEGEALNRTIHEKANSTRSREDRIAAIGDRYGLNTTAYRQSMSLLQNITGTIAAQQQNFAAAAGPLAPSVASLELVPDRGTYNDTITIAGTVSDLSEGRNASVEIVLDSHSIGTASIDPSGSYRYLLPIEKIASGTHFVYVRAGSSLSDIEQFDVFPQDTAITLEAAPASGIGTTAASCTGSLLTAGGHPVAHAPVNFTIDGRTGAESVTEADGSYVCLINLTPGTHTITAAFSGEDFPLNESSSQPITINLIPGFGSSTNLMAVAIVGIASILGGNWYLRRSRNAVPPPEKPLSITESPPEAEVLEQENEPRMADEDLRLLGSTLISTDDPREGVALLYRALFERLATMTRVPLTRAKTPRELLENYRNQPFASTLADFVELHERICYAGRIPDSRERQRLVELFIGILTPIPGDDDE